MFFFSSFSYFHFERINGRNTQEKEKVLKGEEKDFPCCLPTFPKTFHHVKKNVKNETKMFCVVCMFVSMSVGNDFFFRTTPIRAGK